MEKAPRPLLIAHQVVACMTIRETCLRVSYALSSHQDTRDELFLTYECANDAVVIDTKPSPSDLSGPEPQADREEDEDGKHNHPHY